MDAGCSAMYSWNAAAMPFTSTGSTGLHFAGAIFSNITHDHLDYHKTFDEYIRVRNPSSITSASDAFAISNLDDKRGTVMLQNTPAENFITVSRRWQISKERSCDNSLAGLQMMVNDMEVHFRLIGEFNAYNLLAFMAAAVCLGEDKQEVLLY